MALYKDSRFLKVDDKIILSNSKGVSKEVIGIREIDRTSSGEGFQHIVSVGDDCFTLALRYYGDAKLWHIIADKNPEISDPLVLQFGEQIFIPERGR